MFAGTSKQICVLFVYFLNSDFSKTLNLQGFEKSAEREGFEPPEV